MRSVPNKTRPAVPSFFSATGLKKPSAQQCDNRRFERKSVEAELVTPYGIFPILDASATGLRIKGNTDLPKNAHFSGAILYTVKGQIYSQTVGLQVVSKPDEANNRFAISSIKQPEAIR